MIVTVISTTMVMWVPGLPTPTLSDATTVPLVDYDLISADVRKVDYTREPIDLTGPYGIELEAEDTVGKDANHDSEQASAMRLGASLFWGLGGLKHGRPELKQQLREYADAGVDFVRTLIHLNSSHPSNPWKKIGLHAEDPDLEEQLTRYLDVVSSYGMKVHYTLLGGMADMERTNQQDRFVDRVSNAIRSRLDKIELLEVMNEYGGDNGGSILVLHRMAKRLRANLGDNLVLALSSPYTVHQGGSIAEIQAEVKAMRLDEANAITPHWNRDRNEPPDLGEFAPGLVICAEPRGPRSPGRGTDNPADIEHDWKAAETAGYYAYVLHSDSGVWSTYISDEYKDGTRGMWPIFSTHTNGDAILKTVKRLRRGDGVAGRGSKRAVHWTYP